MLNKAASQDAAEKKQQPALAILTSVLTCSIVAGSAARVLERTARFLNLASVKGLQKYHRMLVIEDRQVSKHRFDWLPHDTCLLLDAYRR